MTLGEIFSTNTCNTQGRNSLGCADTSIADPNYGPERSSPTTRTVPTLAICSDRPRRADEAIRQIGRVKEQMAWVQVIDPDRAAGALRDIYREIAAARGGIANVHRVQSLNARALRAHLELYRAVMFARSTLSRIMRERIAVVVSEANRCAYCVAHHSEALRQLGDDPGVLESLCRGELPVVLEPAHLELLRWARRAALQPHECSQSNVQSLQSFGFDDKAILDAALTVAYFSFVNRLVLTLGVDVEEDYASTCKAAAEES
jgi:uncharacterized peroxidase-related enzyme